MTMIPALLLQSDDAAATVLLGLGGTFLIFMLVIAVIFIIGMWKTFVKAGQPGWAAIIPIYNAYILTQIAGRPGWWVLLMLIPLVGLRGVRPRPPLWLRLASLSGLLMTALYIVLSVFPIIKVESVSTFALKITLLILAMNVVGFAILRSADRRRVGSVRL